MKKMVSAIRSLPRREKLRLAWDLFMVWVALINLWMILFDLTYLWIRPVYFRYLPVVTRIYDPVKGIEPHPLTEQFLHAIDSTRNVLLTNPDPQTLDRQLAMLRELSVRILDENPFERSGRTRVYERLLDTVAHQAGTTADALKNRQQLERAVKLLWPSDPGTLRYRLDHLDPATLNALKTNYYRTRDRWGRPTDHFWMLDLPFLVIFWIEFLVRWIISLRRRTYARWFFFPIFNWYDVLGLLPSDYFRPFRLLRLVSVYMRLRRSELSSIGRDYFSRTVAYFSNILTEEVSDRVALRILSEVEEEVADGTHVRIIRSVLEPRRGEIEEVLVDQLASIVGDEATMERFRELVLLNLETAIEESESLRTLPVPHVVVKPIVRTVGEVLLNSTLETVQTTLESDEGRWAVRDVVASVLDDVFTGPGPLELEPLVREIVLQIVAHMKDVVAVKKWALPDGQERRVPFPWESPGPEGEA